MFCCQKLVKAWVWDELGDWSGHIRSIDAMHKINN